MNVEKLYAEAMALVSYKLVWSLCGVCKRFSVFSL